VRATGILNSLDYASPNASELVAMAAAQRAAAGLPQLSGAPTVLDGLTAEEEIGVMYPYAYSLLRVRLPLLSSH
jgi:hypothetical protein